MFYKKKKLINKMKKLNLTYKDLADLTGYCYGHIAHAMNGDYQMSTRMRNKILKALNEVNATKDVKVVEVKDEQVDKEKKYFVSAADIAALKDTDTIIYTDDPEKTYRFVGGVLCSFMNGDLMLFNDCISHTEGTFLLVDKPRAMATKENVGKLCKFVCEENKQIRVLHHIQDAWYGLKYVDNKGDEWGECYPLTPEEVKELTGYEVKGK